MGDNPRGHSLTQCHPVAHELCHLRVPNHSRRFWALVEGRRPHWREQRTWLREHGPELLAFKASE
jgi:predicted metal-dependent hydrolase